MAYTNIDDPSVHFQSYAFSKSSGTGSATFDGNSDLQPDFLWVKSRTNADSHELWDSTRGVNSTLFSDNTSAEDTAANRIVSFDTDGFTWGNAGNLNAAGDFVSWAWKANGGTTSSNTDGTITSTVQVNSDAGFSIGTFTGNGTSGATVGHGLGVKPDMLILKSRNNPSGAAMYWIVGHVGLDGMAGLKNLFMNQTWAVNTESVIWANTAPTSSVFSVGTNAAVNYTGNNMLFYAFAEKQGFSKFGKYTGNNSFSGPFVYTGFKPAFMMIKRTDSTSNWLIIDSARDPANDGISGSTGTNRLFPNLNNAEDTAEAYDLLSNGFKPRTTNALANTVNATYIYMAFAENPFVSSTGIPTTAR
jgi:hypothetical protein